MGCDATLGSTEAGSPSSAADNMSPVARAAVLSADGERTVRRLMLTLAQHRRSEAALSGQLAVGRLQVLPTDSLKFRRRREGVLVRAISITEAYVHGQLQARLDIQAPSPRTTLVENLYGQAEDQATSSWNAAADYYKKYVSSTNIKGFYDWNQVDAVIEARNAVIHGLGSFTARRVRRNVPSKVAPHLTALKFQVNAARARILVTGEALEKTTRLLRSYLEWLDNQLQLP